MSTSTELLTDAFGRVQEAVHEAVAGLTPQQLAVRLDEEANSIAWLVWHLTRVQDDHIADAAGSEQIWTAEGWNEEFALPLSPEDTGFGHSSEDVAAVEGLTAELLTDYHDAVHDRTVEYVAEVADKDLEQVIDDTWTPSVTLATRLISVIADDLQHAGQAAYLRGVLLRR